MIFISSSVRAEKLDSWINQGLKGAGSKRIVVVVVVMVMRVIVESK
jgi:hypothetical protein